MDTLKVIGLRYNSGRFTGEHAVDADEFTGTHLNEVLNTNAIAGLRDTSDRFYLVTPTVFPIPGFRCIDGTSLRMAMEENGEFLAHGYISEAHSPNQNARCIKVAEIIKSEGRSIIPMTSPTKMANAA